MRKPDKALNEELGWRRRPCFPPHVACSRRGGINRYNSQKLVIEDPSIARLTLDGTFPVHAVPDFIEVAQAVFGLRIERQADHTSFRDEARKSPRRNETEGEYVELSQRTLHR